MISQLELQMKALRQMGRKDEVYMRIEAEFSNLENQLEIMAAELTKEQQDLLWAYICTSDALDYRLLEIACGFIQWKDLNI